jgi:hypothetical protein
MEGQGPGSLRVQRAADCNRAAGVNRREKSLRTGKGSDDPAYCGCICEVADSGAHSSKGVEETRGKLREEEQREGDQAQEEADEHELDGKANNIAEYLGEIREIKVNLQAAGQTVSDMELAVHALNGLPEEYATLVKILEMGETELNLDVIQPKLMQKEQKLKLQAEVGATKEDLEDSRAEGAGAADSARMGGSSKG